MSRLAAESCIFAPIATLPEVASDPQVAAAGAIATISDPRYPDFRVVNAPFGVRNADMRPRGPAAEVGAHTKEVLREAGFDDAEVELMHADGTVGFRKAANAYGAYVDLHPELFGEGE